MLPIPPVDPTVFTPNRFAGKVLRVTGAAFGSIGGCAAVRAAREGAAVLCVDRRCRSCTKRSRRSPPPAAGRSLSLPTYRRRLTPTVWLSSASGGSANSTWP